VNRSIIGLCADYFCVFKFVACSALFCVFFACSDTDSKQVTYLYEAPETKEEDLVQDAMNSYESGMYSYSRRLWNELRDGYPGSYYVPFAELKLADSYFYSEDYTAAIVAYEEFIRLHPGHEAGDYALYQIARAYHNQYQGLGHDSSPLKSAIDNYRRLLKESDSAYYRSLARQNIALCRNLLAESELSVARFYFKLEQRKASAARYRALLEEYRDTQAVAEAEKELLSLFASQEEFDALLDQKTLSPASREKLLPSVPKVETTTVTDVKLAARPQMVREQTLLVAEREEKPIPQRSGQTAGSKEEPTTEPPPGADFVSRIDCEEQGDLSVFTAFLHVQASVKNLFDDKIGKPESQAKIALVEPKERSLSAGAVSEKFKEQEIDSFSTGGNTIEITRTDDLNKIQYRVSLRTKQNKEIRISSMSIDRPFRLITVIQPVTTLTTN